MFKINLILIIIFICLISCKSPYCSEIDQTPCGELCNQAERLIQKLLDDPDNWMCILEIEKCIDCNYFVQKYYKEESSRIYLYKKLKFFNVSNCKMKGCIRIPNEQLSNMVVQTKLGIIVVNIDACKPSIYSTVTIKDPYDYCFVFKIINEKKLELIYFDYNVQF